MKKGNISLYILLIIYNVYKVLCSMITEGIIESYHRNLIFYSIDKNGNKNGNEEMDVINYKILNDNGNYKI